MKIISGIVFLLATTCVQVHQAAPSDGEAISEAEAERVFGDFVGEQRNKVAPLVDDPSDLGEHLSDAVDLIAEQLNKGTLRSAKLREALAKAINAKEILHESKSEPATPTSDLLTALTNARRNPSTGFSPAGQKVGLLNALNDDQAEKNPHILHATRSINYEQLRAETLNELSRLPRREQERLTAVSGQVVALEDAGKDVSLGATKGMADSRVPPIRALGRLVATVAKYGLKVMDKFYAAPEFIMSIPMIGEHLAVLKKKGEPLYNMVNFVRSSAYLLRFSGVIKGEEPQMLNGVRVMEAKTMVSRAGASALKSVAYRVIKKLGNTNVSEEDTQEFVSRTLFAIITNMISYTSRD